MTPDTDNRDTDNQAPDAGAQATPHRGRTALVTGASAGIGREFAKELARRGFNLALAARRRDRLEALAAELRTKHGIGVQVLVCDLADPATPERLHAALAGSVEVLVNNAGYAVPGYFQDTPWAAQAALLQVMAVSVAHTCHLFAPEMAARGRGRIINVASLAGLLPPSPGSTLYAPIKSFVIKLSQALHAEYAGAGVHVLALCPGFTDTEFPDVMGNRAQVSRIPAVMWMDAAQVAQEAVDAVMRGKPVHTNGRINRAIATAARLMPQRLAAALMARSARNLRASGAPGSGSS